MKRSWLCWLFGHKYWPVGGMGFTGGIKCYRCGKRPEFKQ